MKHPPYPAYKASGVGWLGNLPAHWELKRLKYCASLNDDALPQTSDPELEVDYVDIGNVDEIQGVTDSEHVLFEEAPSRARRLVRDGDTIFSTVRAYLRAIAPIKDPPQSLVVSTGFAVIRPRNIDPGFLSYALREMGLVGEVVAQSVGVSYPAIGPGQVASLPIPCPSRIEQHAIAGFLDRETAKIDTLIAKKRELIEKLNEKRSALISRVVMRGLPPEAARAAGLDPNPPLKPSGIDWLGEIPAHWNVLPLKRMAQVRQGAALGRDLGGAPTVEMPYLRVANVQAGWLDLSEITTMEVTEREVERFKLRDGDVLMNEGGDNDKLGRGTVWKGEISDCLHQNHVFAVRLHDPSMAEWVAAFTQAANARFYFWAEPNRAPTLLRFPHQTSKNCPSLSRLLRSAAGY